MVVWILEELVFFLTYNSSSHILWPLNVKGSYIYILICIATLICIHYWADIIFFLLYFIAHYYELNLWWAGGKALKRHFCQLPWGWLLILYCCLKQAINLSDNFINQLQKSRPLITSGGPYKVSPASITNVVLQIQQHITKKFHLLLQCIFTFLQISSPQHNNDVSCRFSGLFLVCF